MMGGVIVIHAIQGFGGIFGGVAALFWFGRKLVVLDKTVNQLNRLASAELNHNGGHSTKDYAAKGYRKAKKVERQICALEQRFNDHMSELGKGNVKVETETNTTTTTRQQPVGFRQAAND